MPKPTQQIPVGLSLGLVLILGSGQPRCFVFSIEKWRKQVIAGQADTAKFALIADEGSYLPGGEGTAPTPLTYFTSGIAL